jgi:hypothetical protein
MIQHHTISQVYQPSVAGVKLVVVYQVVGDALLW